MKRCADRLSEELYPSGIAARPEAIATLQRHAMELADEIHRVCTESRRTR